MTIANDTNRLTPKGIFLATGQLSGYEVVHKFGYNKGVPNAAWEGVLSLSSAFPWLTAATTIRIKAGNAADDAAGAGARTITVQGLDATGAEIEETLTTAGESASAASSASFMRVHRAWVATSGAYTAANTGAVVIENAGAGSPMGGTDLLEIPAGEGQSQHCGYTIPLGKTGYLSSMTVQADAAKAADFRLRTRASFTTTSPPHLAARTRYYFDGVLGVVQIQTTTPTVQFPALTDVWIEAYGGGAGTEVSADMEIILKSD